MFKIYKTYYGFLCRYKSRFVLFGLSIIGLSLASSIQPYFYKLFIDNIANGDFKFLLFILFGYIGIRLAELMFDNLTYFLGDSVVIPASKDARLEVFKKIQDLDFAFHLSKSTGSLISILKRGDNAFFDLHHTINVRLSQVLINFIIMLGFFTSINWKISAAMIFSLTINLLFAKFLIGANIKARSEFNKEEDEISDIIVDNLINFETVKLFARENWEFGRLKHRFGYWSQKLWNYVNTFRLIDITVGTTGNLGLFIVLLIGLNQVRTSSISVGTYIMVLGFVGNFYPKFFEMIYEFRNLAKHHVDIEKYLAILDYKTKVLDPVHPVNLTHVKGNIDFKNLSFSYPDGKKGALKNINLSIKSGESIAFVGHSGVGKTTLIKLLMRFYDPDKGEILLDGENIKNFNKNKLRSFLGIVPQEPVLFNNTIAYNIGYGANNPSLKEIMAAAKTANLHSFIESLPGKYETQVGERGVKLSGGQKQRLAIARMIISNPDIIIFDEATSQLDSESEKQIQDAFWKAAKNRTTLIIAHRLSTITRSDKIIVMKKGQIVEIGSHKDLTANSQSLYSHFWNLQSNA